MPTRSTLEPAPSAEPIAEPIGRVAPPNGPALGFDLSSVRSEDHLLADRRGALHALASDAKPFAPDRSPLVLVHGLKGRPGDLQALVNRLVPSSYQLYVLCYDSYHRHTAQSGDDLADELRALPQLIGNDRPLTLIAHSMGGIVTRRALLSLSYSSARGIERFSSVRFLAVDTPWHGYQGPSDRGLAGLMMDLVRPLMPDALEDMRAASALFQGNPASADPLEHAGLYGQMLTPDVQIELVFADHRTEVTDYTMPPVSSVNAAIAGKIANGTSIAGDTQMINFWHAILDSSAYSSMRDELEQQSMGGVLDEKTVQAALARHYPRFPGDHMTVLSEHPGGTGLLDELVRRLV